MRAFTTIRARTTLLATVVTTLVLVIGSVVLLAVLSGQLRTSKDDEARSQVRDLLSAARAGDLPRVLHNLDDNSVEQVVGPAGTVLASSSNVRGRPAILPPQQADGDPRLVSASGPDDQEVEHYRLWVASGQTPQGQVTVLVGHSLESVGEATRTLRRTLLIGVPLLLLLFVVAIWLVVGRALRRIDRITETVAGIRQTDLDRRVPETGIDDEVGRLAVTMNAMLARLQEAGGRQRQFVADASHDLQSPLTGMRSALEVAIAHPEHVDQQAMARQLLATSQDMEVLVQDLLALALLDEELPLRGVPVDLDEIAVEEVARMRPATTATLDVSGVSAAPVTGDPAELRRLVRNLLDNAVRHATSRVRVSAGVDHQGVFLEVADDGLGVPSGDRDHVFDRFHRADPARGPGGRRGGGSGLGLAIARRVAERHSGTLELAEGPGGLFQLRLPSQRTV